MPIIGLNYTKIDAARNGDTEQKLNINTTPKILNFKKATLEGLGNNIAVARVNFEYRTTIEPNIAHLIIEGIIIYENKDIDKIEKHWEKEKKLLVDTQIELINYIFKTVSIKALMISEMLQMPPIINLPSIKGVEKAKEVKEAPKKTKKK